MLQMPSCFSPTSKSGFIVAQRHQEVKIISRLYAKRNEAGINTETQSNPSEKNLDRRHLCSKGAANERFAGKQNRPTEDPKLFDIYWMTGLEQKARVRTTVAQHVDARSAAELSIQKQAVPNGKTCNVGGSAYPELFLYRLRRVADRLCRKLQFSCDLNVPVPLGHHLEDRHLPFVER